MTEFIVNFDDGEPFSFVDTLPEKYYYEDKYLGEVLKIDSYEEISIGDIYYIGDTRMEVGFFVTKLVGYMEDVRIVNVLDNRHGSLSYYRNECVRVQN